MAASPGWVAAACRAKQIALDAPVAGEEWLAGPAVTARNIRLLTESLQHIARRGRPPLGRKVRTRADGLVEVSVLPAGMGIPLTIKVSPAPSPGNVPSPPAASGSDNVCPGAVGSSSIKHDSDATLTS